MYLSLSYLLSGYIQLIRVCISYICDTVQKRRVNLEAKDHLLKYNINNLRIHQC